MPADLISLLPPFRNWHFWIWIRFILWTIHQVHQISLEMESWILLQKCQFSYISWLNFDTNITFFRKRVCLMDFFFFTQIQIHQVFYSFLFLLAPLISALNADQNCFTVTLFSYQGTKFLKPFLLLNYTTWIYFQQPFLSFNYLLISAKRTFPHSTLLFSIFQQFLDISF